MYRATLPSNPGHAVPRSVERAPADAPPPSSHGTSESRPPSPIRVVAEEDAHRLLPRARFLKELHRERRRVDRSTAALSIVVFKPEGRADEATFNAELPTVLLRATRETDIVGWLDRRQIAVLLPDTDAAGAEAFVRKLALSISDPPIVAATGTYPDQLFAAIEGGRSELADFRSIFVEEGTANRTANYPLKRALDFVGALVCLVLASPLMLLAALAVRMSSPGPAIFCQTRLGLHGKPFVFYKFRSMYCDNDDRIHREFVNSLINGEHDAINQGDASNPSYKMKADPRITRVGSFIRRTSLDELPQLFNVLKGDMSLVGPRPALPYEVEKYRSWHLRRVLEVRPGITGLWQVEGRSRTTFDEMVRLDLRYVRTCTLWNDLRILAKTALAVLRRDGAG